MIVINRTEAKPRRWISKECPEHVDKIATICIECEEFNDRMEREVCDWILAFSCTDDGIASRRRGARCDAALGALRDMDDADRHSMPTLRRGSDSLCDQNMYVMIKNEILLLGETFLKKGCPPDPFQKTFATRRQEPPRLL